MTLPDAATFIVLAVGAVLLVGANVALQRLARPDHGSQRIAGCCGMALPVGVTEQTGDES